MSKVLRISTEVFEKLELNAIGFDTPSDVIERAIHNHEEFEIIKLVTPVIISAEELIKTMGCANKTVLLHQQKDAIHRAMIFIIGAFTQFKIKYDFNQPCLNVEITLK